MFNFMLNFFIQIDNAQKVSPLMIYAFNFRTLLGMQKYFNTDNFLNYSKITQSVARNRESYHQSGIPSSSTKFILVLFGFRIAAESLEVRVTMNVSISSKLSLCLISIATQDFLLKLVSVTFIPLSASLSPGAAGKS